MRPAALPTLAALVLCLAGCGGHSGASATTGHAGPGQTVGKRPCRAFGPKQRRAVARLRRDVAALKRAEGTPTKDTFKGNPAINRATDRFLLDQGSLPLDNYTRNRYFNLAIAAATPVCQQCFQALEAERPIVQASLNQPGALPCPPAKP